VAAARVLLRVAHPAPGRVVLDQIAAVLLNFDRGHGLLLGVVGCAASSRLAQPGGPAWPGQPPRFPRVQGSSTVCQPVARGAPWGRFYSAMATAVPMVARITAVGALRLSLISYLVGLQPGRPAKTYRST